MWYSFIYTTHLNQSIYALFRGHRYHVSEHNLNIDLLNEVKIITVILMTK